MRNTSSFGLLGGAFLVVIVILGLIYMVRTNNQTGPNPQGTTLTKAPTQDDHSSGNQAAKVTLVEYSDFQCPACAAYKPLVDQLMKEYGDRVRFVYRHFPLPQHQNARPAAYAAEAAAQQGKFFEMYDLLFAGQLDWAEKPDATAIYTDYAKTLGLDLDQFKKDSASKAIQDRVEKDYISGRGARVAGTPTFFINGKSITNPRDYDGFKALIEHALNS